MIKVSFSTLTALALLSAGPAFANMGDKHDNQMPKDQQESMIMDETMVSDEERMDEVAGIRIVPSVIAKDVHLTPSAWFLRGEGNMANANAKIYHDRDGAITGLTLKAWGLPNPDVVNPRFDDYVVWLVNSDTNEMKNIGVLESRNGGEAVFGYSAQEPLVGYDRIVVTPEPTFATGWPSGRDQLTADLAQVSARPVIEADPTPIDNRELRMQQDRDNSMW